MLDRLAVHLSLASLLDQLFAITSYRVLDYWPQGEFHNDLVLEILDPLPDLPGSILVISTDCNGGVKELFCFSEAPDRWALWHLRCPDNPEFFGSAPLVLGWIKTPLWVDPCMILSPNAPSELLPECRQRQQGGGWVLKDVQSD
jgi:hypothetical protein